MKFALLLAAFVMTSANAYDCRQYEAQIIGKVTSVRVESFDQGIRDCYYTADFSDYREHQLCPLDQASVQAIEILDADCRYNLQVGQGISGYLIQFQHGQIILE